MDAVAESGRCPESISTINQSDSACVWRMSGRTRDETAEPVSRGHILRRERGQQNIRFPCTAATTSRIIDHIIPG